MEQDLQDLIEKTKKTAQRLFSGPVPIEVPYKLWKSFDPDLARDLSLFITGKFYSREILPLPERQMIAVAALAALQKTEELKVHIHGALNVGVPPAKLAETVFQIGIYSGFPAVNAALAALKEVLVSRGQWPIAEEPQPKA
ncbi:MAG: carboxymuconolactone decarboxylase family protein [Syntrophobacteraceae bacterium]|jgi:4-carboxymuconolactone decarboxylase|nr:carboxymuconolactone decarboxylase family protein [Syntrophobacteraceae bacterium]